MADDVRVTVQCVGCGKKREITPNSVASYDVPMCHECLSPMVAQSAATNQKAASDE